jgi:hypothetical protein
MRDYLDAVIWADQKQLFLVIGPFEDLYLLCIFTTPNSISCYLNVVLSYIVFVYRPFVLLLLVEMLLLFISFSIMLFWVCFVNNFP